MGLSFVSSPFLAGLSYPKKVWIWAILTGAWIPLKGIIFQGDLMFLIILVIPFAGSYFGRFLKNTFAKG